LLRVIVAGAVVFIVEVTLLSPALAGMNGALRLERPVVFSYDLRGRVSFGQWVVSVCFYDGFG